MKKEERKQSSGFREMVLKNISSRQKANETDITSRAKTEFGRYDSATKGSFPSSAISPGREISPKLKSPVPSNPFNSHRRS